MPSALDLRVREVTDKLTAPGAPMAVATWEKDGVTFPIIATAPPSLPPYFAFLCMQHGTSEFIVCNGERLTFAETFGAARAIAAGLIAGHGIKKGDRVGIAMRNAPSWIAAYMGVLMAGGVATLLNGWWQGGELIAGIDSVGCTLVICDEQRAARIADAGYDGAAKVVKLDIGAPLSEAIEPLELGGSDDIPLPEMSGDDIATILFTSGSTGQSKGAFSTHRAVIQATFNYICQQLLILEIAVADGLVSADENKRAKPAMLLSVPLFHVTGEVPMLLVSFAAARKIVIMPKWDATAAMALIEREKITNFTGVPLMSFEIMTHPDRDKYDLSSLQGLAGGGAPRPVEHVKRLAEAFPTAPPALGYGLTETNGAGAGNFMSNYLEKPNSTGVASKPLIEIAILDDAGNRLPQGQKGEVSIRSVCNFSGYWDNPAATAACMTADGFFRSGDIGYLDEDDYLFIVDRKKDIIIRGGENISCQEVEAALYEHPAVAEACVFGLADERLGEVPGAVVHLHEGLSVSVSEDELRAHVKARLAAYNTPERVWIEPDALPRLGTEKIDKVSLRARFRDAWERQSQTV